jgi:UDPglucose 6-dehydrogenase
MNTAIFGLGFVGLTTALGLADKGFNIRGYDIDETRHADISSGKLPFIEPGLGEAVTRNLGRTFTVSGSAAEAAAGCDLCFVCVGTPSLPDGNADLNYIFSAIDSMGDSIAGDCVIVIKSTVPPGTTAAQIEPYIRAKGMNNPVAVNPEFLREGKCWEDFTKPDRIICGVTDELAKSELAALYAPFNAPVRFVTPDTAEFVKYLSNSLLATLISYSNEMALLAEAVGGVDTAAAFHALHEDRRLAGAGINSYIYPGCGYGGYCLPKDTAALAALAKAKGSETRILGEVIALNDKMAALTARKIERVAGGDKTTKIGILGLSFKPESDDVRDSPAAKIIAALIDDGYADIWGYDPMATSGFEAMYKLPIQYAENAREICETRAVIAVVTAWDEFRSLRHEHSDVRWVDCRYCLD